jgi:ribosomal protein L7/L12
MQLAIGIVVGIVIALLLRKLFVRGESGYTSHGLAGCEPEPTEESIREAMRRGRKIEAIKAYRRLHRVDLKTAKESVERIAEQLPRAI